MHKINNQSSIGQYGQGSSWIVWLFGLLLLIIVFIRIDAHRFDYQHPDEIIAVKVTEQVLNSGRWDTNWQHADLPPLFKYPQYNFSGYLLFAATILKLVQSFGADNILYILRYLSALLGIITMGLTYIVGRQWFSSPVAWIATVIVGINPLLFQDSLYARPETFLTCLTLSMLWVQGSARLATMLRLFLAALILGIAIGTKLSMLAFLPLLFLPLVSVQRDSSKNLLAFIGQYLVQLRRYGWLVAVGVGLGFVLAVPYAPFNTDAFLNGFQALQKQYTLGQWPHGLADGTLVECFNYALGYFIPTMGAVLWVCVLIAGLLLLGQKRYRLLTIWGVAVTFFVIFATYHTFYERNFSHLIPLFSLFAAYALVAIGQKIGQWWHKSVLTSAVLAVLLLALLFPAARLSFFLYHSILPGVYKQQVNTLRKHLEQQYQTTAIVPGFTSNYYWLSRYMAVPNCANELLEYWTTGDRYTTTLPAEIISNGFREVGRVESPFAGIVPSTLHTYFAHDTRFFYRPFSATACAPTVQHALTQQGIGQAIEMKTIHQDANWSLAGAYGRLDGVFGDKYFGSWSGSDSYTGQLQWQLDVHGLAQIALPIITGPKAARQRVTVIDADSQRIVWQWAGKTTPNWKIHRIMIPTGVKSVMVSAEDAGDGWGEWSAIGIPRKVLRSNQRIKP